MQRLTAVVRERGDLDEGDVRRMYALFEQYYEAVPLQTFQTDLAAKSHVIELREEQHLRGFSKIGRAHV